MKEAIIGTSNRILEVNLTTQVVDTFKVSDEDRKRFIGAKGLGLKLLNERLKTGVDPLGPDNYLAFMTGVLIGTGAPCSARFAAVTKSPLTGLMLSCSCGGPFGRALKTAGYDGLLVTGMANSPVCLKIDAHQCRIEDADDLWQMDIPTCRSRLDRNAHIGSLIIGPAGEQQVPIANIASGHRYLGRGGMGAVMGSKNLKAVVAIGGTYRIEPKKPTAFKKIKTKATRYIQRNAITSHAYRRYGTASHVNWCNSAGILPVHNFRDGQHDQAHQVSGETYQTRYHSRHHTCRPCSIMCGHKGVDDSGTTRTIPEYESLGLLGPNLGIFDPDQIMSANDTCNRLGMDTISAGAILGFVMEAGQKGLIDTTLNFGQFDGIVEALEQIAFRTGFGDQMGRGTRYLADRFGGNEFAIHVKGLELAAYDPRGCWGQGLAYAVANRGGCHLSATVFSLEASLHLLNPFVTRAKARFVDFFEKLFAAVNSLQTCQFTTYAYVLEPPLVKYTPRPLLRIIMGYWPWLAIMLMDISVFPRLFQAVTGIPMNSRQWLKAGKRIRTLERLMNTREGISRKDDTLPDRFIKEGRSCDPKNRTVPLEPMLNQYYRISGYDSSGIPTPRTLKKLSLPQTPKHLSTVKQRLAIRTPGNKRFKRFYLSVMLWFMGRAIQAAGRIDKQIRAEFDQMPADFSFALGISPHGPWMVVGKNNRGKSSYIGRSLSAQPVDLVMHIKHTDAAFRMFTFQDSTAAAVAADRLVVDGDLAAACRAIRIFNAVEVYLLPRFIARRAVKKVPTWSIWKRTAGRLAVYGRTLAGF